MVEDTIHVIQFISKMDDDELAWFTTKLEPLAEGLNPRTTVKRLLRFVDKEIHFRANGVQL